MSNIPVEGTWAGDVLAIMTVAAPLSSLFASAFIRPKFLAFMGAVALSGSIIFLGVWSSYDDSANQSVIGASVFAGWAGLISLFIATVVTIGRTIITSPTPALSHSAEKTDDQPSAG